MSRMVCNWQCIFAITRSFKYKTGLLISRILLCQPYQKNIAWLAISWTCGLCMSVDVCELDALLGFCDCPLVVFFGCGVLHSAHLFHEKLALTLHTVHRHRPWNRDHRVAPWCCTEAGQAWAGPKDVQKYLHKVYCTVRGKELSTRLKQNRLLGVVLRQSKLGPRLRM